MSVSAVQTHQRGFWRLLAVREGRQRTHFPPPRPFPDAAALQTFADLDANTYFVPVSDAAPAATAPDGGNWATDGMAVQGEANKHAANNEECDTAPWRVDMSRVPATLQQDGSGTEQHVAAQEPPPPPDDVALLVQINPKFTTPDATNQELQALQTYITTHRPDHLPAPTVFAVQENELAGNGAPAGAPVYACPGAQSEKLTFQDALCDVHFELSSTSFFQVPLHVSSFRAFSHGWCCRVDIVLCVCLGAVQIVAM